MREGRMRTSYVVTDYVTTLVSVAVFSVLRYNTVPDIAERCHGLWRFMPSEGVILTFILFPPFMLLVYYLTGYYIRMYNKSRVTELVKTFVAVVLGSLAFFLVVLLNDVPPTRVFNYEILLMFAGVLFVCVYIGRVSLTTRYLYLQRRPGGVRRAVLVTDLSAGAPDLAEIKAVGAQHGISIIAVADASGCQSGVSHINELPVIEMAGISGLKGKRLVTCIMLDAAPMSTDRTLDVLNNLFKLDMPVFVSPDMRGVIMGTVRYDSVMADPLVDISRSEFPDNVVAIKRFIDIVASGIGLIVTSPLILVLGGIVKWQTPGPAIYSQERIGYRKRPFKLYKLRSMLAHAEPAGPMLASPHDSRITPIGQVMRKYRLDELPNLWNVLKGDMSLVGPRPERMYYINQIIARAPHYTLVHQVRPGLTSWGMVKYGYACDVDGMVERLKYDMLYLQNMSLSLDLRILYHTLFTVVRGEGK